MADSFVKILSAALTISMVTPGFASAGGLAAAIVEEPPVIAEPAPVTQGATASWVVPLVALLLVGAVIASDSGSDDSDNDGDAGELPDVGGVK
ncbi:hypothetical protein [Roseobacter sp. CCS2]|uniref:hypothetical protein n=1 Tax=Roseobacter sp. CCS2 TaxID=391593 RepID=UPI0000F3C3F0|nr:hypothetical protein [Roseobacter sp. CCS2]EBA11903.1 hypothetical protein RCCS2_18281 [Roseobacter sp. CCS2]